jgi:proteic killer suppression protein
LNIRYKNEKLSSECKDFRKAKKHYGDKVAGKLHEVIEFIEAAESLRDIRNFPPFHFHDLKGNKSGLYTIDLGRKLGFRLIIKPLDSQGSPCHNDVIFSVRVIEIVTISVEEVSNHYE